MMIRTSLAALATFVLFAAGEGKVVPAEAPRVAAAPKPSLALRLAGDGVAIDAGGMGQFTLKYPVLVGEQWDQVRKPIEQRVNDRTATILFDAGASIAVSLQPATAS